MNLKEILLEAEEKVVTLNQLKQLFKKYKFVTDMATGWEEGSNILILMDIPYNISAQTIKQLLTASFGHKPIWVKTAIECWRYFKTFAAVQDHWDYHDGNPDVVQFLSYKQWCGKFINDEEEYGVDNEDDFEDE